MSIGNWLHTKLHGIKVGEDSTGNVYYKSKRLRFAGVSLVTISEGEISELHVGMRGTMNAMFLRDLAQKIRRGQRGRARATATPWRSWWRSRSAPRRRCA